MIAHAFGAELDEFGFGFGVVHRFWGYAISLISYVEKPMRGGVDEYWVTRNYFFRIILGREALCGMRDAGENASSAHPVQ
jgi:hypothetical protein